MIISFYVGVLSGFIGGTILPYDLSPLIMCAIPIIFVCTFVFMPETPQYLLKRNKIKVN